MTDGAAVDQRSFALTVGFGALGGLAFFVLGSVWLPAPWLAVGILLGGVGAATLACQTARRWHAPGGGLAIDRVRLPRRMFGRGYRITVAVYVVVLVAGVIVLGRVLHAGEYRMPWVTFVVGAHFVVLAAVWRTRAVRVLGWVLTALGVLGAAAVAATGSGLAGGLVGIVAGAVLFANTGLLVRRALA